MSADELGRLIGWLVGSWSLHGILAQPTLLAIIFDMFEQANDACMLAILDTWCSQNLGYHSGHLAPPESRESE